MLSGAVAAACTSATGETIGSTSAALTGGSPCDGVELDASRQYKPKSWTDGQVSFAAGSLTFNVPAEIPVTQGASDHGTTKFTFSQGGGVPTTCVYRGNHGDKYIFVRCKQAEVPSSDGEDDDDEGGDDGPSALLPSAGTSVTADTFTLHVNKGDKKAGTTAVSLHLAGPVISDNNLCTSDACDAAGVITHTPVDIDDHDECTSDACDPLTGISHTAVDTAFCRGRANFNDTALVGLGGNGRACSTCHGASDSFQLSPTTAEARFQALQAALATNPSADDPLFRPLDADDFRTNNGSTPYSYTNLRQNGLVRVTIPLPANIRLLDCGSAIPCPATAQPTTETVADVWRSVPSVFNIAITGPDGVSPTWARGPNTNGGYQLDGRVDTLQHQALGALHGHASISVDPPTSWLDDVTAFQQTLVTPPEPALSPLEQQGKDVFTRACSTCHGGPGATTPFTPPAGFAAQPRYIDLSTAFPRPAGFAFAPATQLAGNVRTYEITRPDGFKFRKTSTDPGRALLTGFVFSAGPPPAVCAHPPCGPATLDDWQKFDVAPLHGIAQTAPYFHNNSAATLNDVLNHYDSFFDRVKVINPTAAILSTTVPGAFDRPVKKVAEDGGAERAALLAYLNKL